LTQCSIEAARNQFFEGTSQTWRSKRLVTIID
jgi:hypothetical protein